MPRRPGRPSKLEEIDRRLSAWGGAQRFILTLDAQGWTQGAIASKITAETGIAIHASAVGKWVGRWLDQSGKEAVA